MIAAQVTTKTEKSSTWQDSTVRASNANKASSKTTTTANSKLPRPPVSSQKQTDVSTVQATIHKSSCARDQADVTMEAARKSRLEVNLPSETFTLHETVRWLVYSKETMAVFTLDLQRHPDPLNSFTTIHSVVRQTDLLTDRRTYKLPDGPSHQLLMLA